MQLMNEIKREGKGKMNVLMCLHACLVYAWRANRIPAVPPFPVKKQYNIVEPVIQWLPSDRQEKVIRAIPTAHQPIFWWLKYHLRRPSEACALLKEDFDGATFMVQRGFSAKEAIDRTKTGEIHPTPAVSSFLPYIDIERDKQRKHGIVSPYFFVHPGGRQKRKALHARDPRKDMGQSCWRGWRIDTALCRPETLHRLADEKRMGVHGRPDPGGRELVEERERQEVREDGGRRPAKPTEDRKLSLSKICGNLRELRKTQTQQNSGSMAEVHGNRTHLSLE